MVMALLPHYCWARWAGDQPGWYKLQVLLVPYVTLVIVVGTYLPAKLAICPM